MSVSTETKSIGRITQIIGPVLDVSFPPGKMPNIYNALTVRGKNEAGQEISVTCEVQQLLGDHCVRAVAMSATDGLMRGEKLLPPHDVYLSSKEALELGICDYVSDLTKK